MHVLDFFMFIKQHLVLVFIWFFLLSMMFYSIIVSWMRGRFEVSCNQLVLLMNQKKSAIIDVRNKHDYDYGYIMDSINVPFDNIRNDQVVLLKKLKNRAVTIVSDNIKTSHSARKYLNKMGFIEVHVLNGGINNWESCGFPLLSKK